MYVIFLFYIYRDRRGRFDLPVYRVGGFVSNVILPALYMIPYLY